jgi:septin family protein
MIKIKPYLALFIIYISLSNYLLAQNINGEKIIVGRESITVINFPDKVLNINFSDDDAYDYYIPKRREEKSISIQFNKEKKSGPNTGLLVNEGGRSHMFRLIYDSTYNINDDTRPPLWYDHSNLKGLKAFVQKQKELEKLTAEEQEKALKQQEKEAAEDRKKEVLAAQKQAEAEAAQKAKDLEKQRKEQEEKQKQSAAEIAKKMLKPQKNK